MAAKKKLGADLAPGVVDQFNDWADACNYTRGGAATSALKLLQVAPFLLRDLALSGKWKEVEKWCKRLDFLMAEDVVRRAGREAADRKEPPASGRKKVGGKG